MPLVIDRGQEYQMRQRVLNPPALSSGTSLQEPRSPPMTKGEGFARTQTTHPFDAHTALLDGVIRRGHRMTGSTLSA
jgi:hypothetical protein